MIQTKFALVFKSRKLFMVPTLLVALELFIGLLQAPWDVDPHHDGIVYGAAVAASEGRVPNQGYFEQYGPFASTLQGIFLKFTSTSLFSLRVSTVLIVTAITISLYFMARKLLGEFGAFSVALLWSLSSPRMHAAMLPWSSFYSTLLLIASIYVLKKLSNKRLFDLNIGFGLAAIFISLASLCRINAIGSFFALITVLLLKREWNALKSSFFGALLVFLTFNGLGFAFRFLKDFYFQCVIWAFGTYSTSGAEDAKGYIVNALMYFTIPFFGLLVVLASQRLKSRIYIPIFLVLALASLLTQNLDSSRESYLNPTYLLAFISKHIHFSFSYFGLFFSLIAVVVLFNRNNVQIERTAIAVIGGSTLSQLYPSPDPLHLWWIAPVGLAAFFSIYDEDLNLKNFRLDTSGYSKFATILAFVMSIALFQEATISRFPYESSTLKKMQGVTQYDRDVDSTLKNLELLNLKGRVAFDCPDGLYAAAGATYLPMTKDFVSWSPRPDHPLTHSEYIFVCNSSIKANSYPVGNDWEIVFEVESSKGSNFLVKRVPNA